MRWCSMSSTRPLVAITVFFLLRAVPMLGCADPGEETDTPDDTPVDVAEPAETYAPVPELAVTDESGVVTVTNGRLRLACDTSDGGCDLRLSDGTLVIRRGWSSVSIRRAGQEEIETARLIDVGPLQWSTHEGSSPLGDYLALRLEGQAEGMPALSATWTLYAGAPFVTVDLVARNTGDQEIAVLAMRPLIATAPEAGGLFVGADPAEHVVLDNGQLRFLDFMAALHSGAEDTYSNWNAAIVDPATGEGVVAGWLSMRRAVPMVGVRSTFAWGITDPDSGRQAFPELDLYAEYLPAKPLAPGEELASERAYLDPATGDPFTALEEYADRIRLNLGYSLWEGPSPNGWNSWSASGGTGGYGTSIDEELMLANLAFLAETLGPWGAGWFQLDDGWQDATGDWNAHVERFPHGMAWFAEQVVAKGLLPGIWVQPMSASASSAFFAEHPGWTVAGPEGPLLDPSLPEVRAHLTALAHKLTHEWGYRWLKVDFAYQLLLASGYADPTLTPEEVYRAGMQAIRDGMAEDTFLLVVAVSGLTYDISHASRVTLDTMPWWGDRGGPGAQGFKDVAATVARRYYLHGHAQINHPDLIVFREEGSGGTPIDAAQPMRPLNETIAFATAVGLCGGIVKIGDRMAVDLGEPQLDVLRRLLPSYGRAGRPIDLFERTYPEVWVLPVTTPWESWTVCGLINWGLNGSGLQTEDKAETTRHFAVAPAKLGLDPDTAHLAFELWSETFLGVVSGPLTVDVEPRHAALVALRPVRDGEVQLLATNRHVTMGATDITQVTWDAAAGALIGEQPVVPNWSYRLWFYIPDGRTALGVTLNGAPATFEYPADGNPRLLRVSFERPDASPVTWRVDTAAD